MSPLQLKFWTQLLTIPEVPISAIRSLLHNALHVYFPCQYWPIEQSIAQFKNDLYFPTCINWKHSTHDMKNPHIKNTLYSYVKKMFNFLKSFIHNGLQSTNRTEIQTIIRWRKKLENGKVKWAKWQASNLRSLVAMQDFILLPNAAKFWQWTVNHKHIFNSLKFRPGHTG